MTVQGQHLDNSLILEQKSTQLSEWWHPLILCSLWNTLCPSVLLFYSNNTSLLQNISTLPTVFPFKKKTYQQKEIFLKSPSSHTYLTYPFLGFQLLAPSGALPFLVNVCFLPGFLHGLGASGWWYLDHEISEMEPFQSHSMSSDTAQWTVDQSLRDQWSNQWKMWN